MPDPIVINPVPEANELKLPNKIWLWVMGSIIFTTLALGTAGDCVYKKTTETYSQQITTLNKQVTDGKTALQTMTDENQNLQKSVDSNSIVLKSLVVIAGKPAIDGTGKPIYNYKYIKTVDSNTAMQKGITIATNATTSTDTTTTTDTTSITKKTKVTQQGVPINGVAYISTGTGIFTGKIGDLSIGVQHAILFDVWLGAEVGAKDITNIPGSFETKISVGAGIP